MLTLGEGVEISFRIANVGTEAIRVTRVEVDGLSMSDFSLSWSEGEIPPAAVQVVTVRLAATAPRTFNAVLRFVGNHTAGTDSIAFAGVGAS
jgi:hypothetical protein